MSDTTEHFDDEADFEACPKLAEDLNALFGSGLSVPAEVDRAVIDRANRHFVRRGRRRPWSRWAASAAAAAAVIIFAVVLETQFSGPSEQESKSDQHFSAPLAERKSKSDQHFSGPLAQRKSKSDQFVSTTLVARTRLASDIDENGRVDILDAFKLARHIESAEVREAKWDINGDGQVNRDDVDVIAFAAVRLDKGV